MPHESVLNSLASTFSPSRPRLARASSRHLPDHLLQCPARSAASARLGHHRGCANQIERGSSRPARRPTSTSWSEGWSTGPTSLPPSATRRRCTGTSGTRAGTPRRVEPATGGAIWRWPKGAQASVSSGPRNGWPTFDVLGRLWSAGVSVPPSEALGPVALPDLSDGPEHRGQRPPGRARRRDPQDRRGGCGERGWRTAA